MKINKKYSVFLFLVSFFLQTFLYGLAQAAETQLNFPVEKYQLSNGLTLLIHEDHTIPMLSYQQWFRVGSAHEKKGKYGFAHFFEHMVFKGTKKYSADVYESLVQKNGGSNNAFTTRDYTGYYTYIPASQLELLIDIESDRMRNLIFDQKEVDSEREVVKEERRLRYENSIFGSLYIKLVETIFKIGPYSWPTIGYMKDLNEASLADFKQFYDQYYVPNNAVVVIAGAVDSSKVKKLVEKYYGHIPSKELPAYNPTPEAEQKAPREAIIEKDVQAMTVGIAYPTIPIEHPDTYALDFLAVALGGGDSSRLHKRIVYKNQLATSVSAGHSSMKMGGFFNFYLSLKPGVTEQNSIYQLNDEIKKMQKTPIDEAELKKLRNIVKLNFIDGLKTLDSRAEQLAEAEVVYGDYRKIFDHLDKYNAVTPADIQRVANTYLIPTKRNTVILRNKGNSVAQVTTKE